MELQISYSICAKIQKNILWRKTRRNREDIERTGRWKEVNIIETEVCLDHIHMLVEIPPMSHCNGSHYCGLYPHKQNHRLKGVAVRD